LSSVHIWKYKHWKIILDYKAGIEFIFYPLSPWKSVHYQYRWESPTLRK